MSWISLWKVSDNRQSQYKGCGAELTRVREEGWSLNLERVGWECLFSDSKQISSAAGWVHVLREREKDTKNPNRFWNTFPNRNNFWESRLQLPTSIQRDNIVFNIILEMDCCLSWCVVFRFLSNFIKREKITEIWWISFKHLTYRDTESKESFKLLHVACCFKLCSLSYCSYVNYIQFRYVNNITLELFWN